MKDLFNKIMCMFGFHDNVHIETRNLDSFGSFETKSICKHCNKVTLEINRYAPTGDVTTFKYTR